MFNAHNISVNFGGETLFDQISFRLSKGDHVGLIGKNGAGKSTLLKLMALKNQPTSGSFVLEKNCKIGYLPQDLDFNNGRSVLEEAYLAFEEIKKVEVRQEEIHKIIEETTDFESSSYMEVLDELNELNNHFELLFGKRKLPPIIYNSQENRWTTKINIVDRSSTERNDLRQSLNVFLKIINSYVGYNAI